MESTIGQLTQRLTDVEVKLEEVSDNVKEIIMALKGNDYTKGGIGETVRDHSTRIHNLEKTLDRAKWVITTLSATSGIGIYEILKTILK